MNFILVRLGLLALLPALNLPAAADVATRIPVFSAGIPVKPSKEARMLLQREDVRLRIASIEKAGHRAELAESVHPHFGAECRAFVLWDRSPGTAHRAGSWRVCTSTTMQPDDSEFRAPAAGGKPLPNRGEGSSVPSVVAPSTPASAATDNPP